MGDLQKVFWAGYADDNMTADEIRLVYERKHYVMDPHTAVGSYVLRQYREQTRDQTPAVLVATASPYKFAPDVASSLLGAQALEGLCPFEIAAGKITLVKKRHRRVVNLF